MDNKTSRDGATVINVTHQSDETFELNREQEARLMSCIAEADRGELISASELLERLRHS